MKRLLIVAALAGHACLRLRLRHPRRWFRLPLALTALGAPLTACEAQTAVRPEPTAVFGDGPLLFTQISEEDLVVFSAGTGEPKFRYRYGTRSPLPFLAKRAPRLLCAPQVTGNRVMLRYEDSVHVLSANDGHLEWQRNCLPNVCPRLCAVAYPGGVAVVTQAGAAVESLDDKGSPQWTSRIEEGPILESPRFVDDKIVLRTRRALIALTPKGEVAFTRDLRPDMAVPLRAGRGPAWPAPRR